MDRSDTDRNTILEFMVAVSQAEARLDQARKQMTSVEQFDPVPVFLTITDKDGISYEQFSQYVNDGIAEADNLTIHQLFASVDKDQDGIVSWGEFLNFFISRTIDPQDKLDFEDLNVQKDQASQNAFLKVVRKELQNQKAIQKAFTTTQIKSNQDATHFFKVLTSQSDADLKADDIASLLSSIVDEKDLDLFAGNFIQRLDFDCDNLISINDWLQFVNVYLKQASNTNPVKTATLTAS